MVASQGAAAASAAGGWGAWGHIGRGLRSTLRGSGAGGDVDNGVGSDCDAVSGTGGGDPRGGARGRWGRRRPVGRLGVTSVEQASVSGVDRSGFNTGKVHREGRLGVGISRRRSLPVLSLSSSSIANNHVVGQLGSASKHSDSQNLDQSVSYKKTALRLAAGVMSTVVVRTLLAPMERIKLEYQLNRSVLPVGRAFSKVIQSEGIKGFWRGNGINLLRVCPYKAINFAAFDAYRGIAVRLSPGGPHDVDRLLLAVAGAAAGVTSVCSCFPMDVVRTRLLVAGGIAKYGGLKKCIAMMYKNEGLGAFYRGFLPAMIAMTPNGAVYYTTYDRLKMNRLSYLEKQEKYSKDSKKGKTDSKGLKGAPQQPIRVEQGYMMLFGAVAGAAAEFSTYPFEVIRRRMQLQGGRGSMSSVFGKRALRRMTTTVRIIVKNHGLKGLYIGVVPSVAQVLPSAALGYYSYELFKIWLNVGDE